MSAAPQIGPVGAKLRALRFAPEFELLLACAQPPAFGELHLDAVLAWPLDWDRVLRAADRHRMLPALYKSLGGRNDVPVSILSAIRARFAVHERRVLRFTAELVRILHHFDRQGIRVLAHKGAAVGQLLYGDPAMRQFGDLDFLLRAADVPRARLVLGDLGYVPKVQVSPRQEREYLRSGYEHGFGMNAGPNLVELQWQILPRFYSIPFDMDALFARSMDLELDGMQLRTLGKEDLMLVLCVHAAKHEWEQLGMLRDIAALARFDLDWCWIEAEARQLGIARILAVSLSLAGSLFSLAPPVSARLQGKISGVSEIAAEIQRSCIAGLECGTESLRYFRAMMRLRERWRDRVSIGWRLAVTPSVGEWQAVRIPDPLFILYRGVRILRLLKRFCFPAKA